MILVYSNQNSISLQELCRCIGDDYIVTTDLDEYRNSNIEFKVAISYDRFGQPGHVGAVSDVVNDIGYASDLVFLIETELHEDNVHHFEKFDKNVYWVLPGVVTDNVEFDQQSFYTLSWPETVAHFYTRLAPTKLSELIDDVKPKYFDALLGQPKPHRTFVYDSIIKNQLTDKFLVSYDPNAYPNQDYFFAKDYFIWEPEVEIPDQTEMLMTNYNVRYLGHSTAASVIVPIRVYNQCAYSIVAETDTDNRFSFFTEKTGKPIMARRLFVVFSGYKFLHNLRSLGFKTFDGIIDESYDLVEDDNQRYSMAFEQVKSLCNQDQANVLNLIKPIVEHNYNILTTSSWRWNRVQQYVANTVKRSQV